MVIVGEAVSGFELFGRFSDYEADEHWGWTRALVFSVININAWQITHSKTR